ncbi:MAG TPA: nucleoside triphosphate pyrophosphohydrolase [Bacteroidota bacterium]|nr:nucleoside triphosphate pyrophosphohydrolase [Bacteroidota bacterium]
MATRRSGFPPVPTKQFARFVAIVRRLRKECPWDRKQTHRSLRESLLEEAYEVIESLDRGDLEALPGELGDLLLHVAMQATIAEEAREFALDDVLRQISAKLVRRHPHVFGSTRVAGPQEVVRNWEALKMREGRTSVLQGVPPGMPALQRALRVQERASAVGFDWKRPSDVWDKVTEELQEVRSARGRTGREEEFGDMLFALVNYARFVGVNPEHALRGSVNRFTARFQYIERALARSGKSLEKSTLKEMDALWEEAKRKRVHRRRA